MIPILYATLTEGTVPSDYGLGALTDCLSCRVEEEKNGKYELTLEYAASGIHADDIQVDRFIKAKPNFSSSPQLFRIYKVGKTMNGRFTVNAQHISYDLSGKIATSGTANSCASACTLLTNNFAGSFTITTDKVVSADFEIDVPSSVRSWFGGKEGSFLDVFGTGEWEYDNYTCRFLLHRGQDRGVQIRYGKNLTELSQSIDISKLVTGVVPYAINPDTQVAAIGTKATTGLVSDVDKDIAVDFTDDIDWESATPVTTQLSTLATSYVTKHLSDMTSLVDSITLNFVQLSNLEERVDLCDTVSIYFEALGISASMKCVATVWDTLAERYISCTFGDVKNNICGTIAEQQTRLEETPTVSKVNEIVDRHSDLITGNIGGYVVLHDSDGDGKPDEILIMDQPTISSATKVWRWNKNGLGYSSTGYSGTYGTAMTANGEIVADFIKAGVISDLAGNSEIDMTTGIAKMYELNAIKGFNLLTEGDEDVRATFSALQFATQLILSATDAENNPFLDLQTYSRTGQSYAYLKMKYDGTTDTIRLEAQDTGRGIFELKNPSGDNEVEAFSRSGGQGGSVRVKNSSGNTQAAMFSDTYGGYFNLFDPNANMRLQGGINAWGRGFHTYFDENDVTRVNVFGDGIVELLDGNGQQTIYMTGSDGEIECMKIKPYDPNMYEINGSGQIVLVSNEWYCYRMGNLVYMSIGFKGNGTSIANGANAFTGTLSDGDLPLMEARLIGYYGGSCFVMRIETNGNITVRNCGGAQTISSSGRLVLAGSFLVQ